MSDALFDQDGNSLPAPEEASFDSLIGVLGMFSSLTDEMDREPHSFTIHGDVLLAQYGRVADVAQWVGLAATALRRDLLEDLGRVPAAGEPSAESAGAGLTRFRVVAAPTQDEYPGASTLTSYTYARSVEEAVARVRKANEKPGGLYGDKGLYRVVEVTEEGPSSEVRRQEAARDDEGNEAPAELIERVLAVCEQHYAAVTGTNSEQWDRESAREVVGIALRTVRLAERVTYPQALEAYLRERRARLERLWRRCGPGGMFAGEVVLIGLPGCFVLCERIDEAPLWLEGVWEDQGQDQMALERLQDSWLYDTGERDGR